jgi:tRNA (mo5U34)-methyltransferase
VFQFRVNRGFQVVPGIDYSDLVTELRGSPLEGLTRFLSPKFLDTLRHGDFQRWRRLIADLPPVQASRYELGDTIRIGQADDIGAEQHAALTKALKQLIPWRKGPFELFGIGVDSEWRGEMKWQRLMPHIRPLNGKLVLDVGCGNGYHVFRMLAAGARLSIGLEPHLPYVGQFWAIKNYFPLQPVHVLPLSLEQFTDKEPAFDTVFSMGVLYHSRSPFDHLLGLKSCLKPGGELVLESIVVPGGNGYSLTPASRYARMGNVWFIPSVATLKTWLHRCGYSNIRLIDETQTTLTEQRPTPWMPFDSLQESLDPENPEFTIEGYPAPTRAILLADA